MILELHAHSKFSFDSIAEPYDILKAAKKIGLNGIAITDHNTIRGAVETQRINDDADFIVIIGTEIATEAGDIIGLFVKEEIESRNSLEVIDEIHRQGGIALLPHPHKGHRLNDEILKKIDVIESFNARTCEADNRKAEELARQYDKPVLVGSDAHFQSEIGKCRVILKGDDIKKEILSGEVEFQTAYSPLYLRHFSQLIKSLKLRKYHKVPVQFIRIIKSFFIH